MRSKRRLYAGVALLALVVAGCGGSSGSGASPPATLPSGSPALKYPGGVTDYFDLNGLVRHPATYRLISLKVLPQAVVTTSASGKNGLAQHTYGGPLLYDLLSAAEPRVEPKNEDDLLRTAIVVSGSDGYRVAIAWAEIDPRFGARKVLVAYEQDGQPLPAADGFARLIVPDDATAGRSVPNIYRLDLVDAAPSQAMLAGRAPTTSLQITGAVGAGGEMTLSKLRSLSQTRVTVEANGAKAVYGGVLLNDLLKSAAIQLDAKKRNDILTRGIVVTGSDGRTSLVVGGEIDPKFGNVQVLVAVTKDGQPLGREDGFARLIVPGDGTGGRSVSNIQRIEVVQF